MNESDRPTPANSESPTSTAVHDSPPAAPSWVSRRSTALAQGASAAMRQIRRLWSLIVFGAVGAPVSFVLLGIVWSTGIAAALLDDRGQMDKYFAVGIMPF